MVGTVGLEGTNSINSELSWKTVTKGKRSKKKLVGRSLNGNSKLGCKSPKRVGDFSGSDSDKFGENGTGQPIIDQIEHVPLKKRRHLLQSPSLPQATLQCVESLSPQLHTLSSHSEDIEHLSDHYGSSGGELYDSDDFSGIALLAATAADCINNIDDETDKIKGDIMKVSSLQSYNTSDSSGPFRESSSCSRSGNLFRKGVASLELKKTLVADLSVESEEGMSMISASSKVDRRHWDLNTPMEAWEELPDDTLPENTLTTEAAVDDGVQKGELGGEGFLLLSSLGNCSENHPHLEQIDTISESLKTKQEENKTEEFSCNGRSFIMETSGNDLNGQSSVALSFCHDDPKSSKVFSKTKSHGSGVSTSGCNTNATSDLYEDTSNAVRSTLSGTTDQDITLPDVPVEEKSACQNDAHMKGAGNCMMEEITVYSCNVLPVEISASTAEDHSIPSSKGEGVSILDISIGGHSTVSGDGKGNEKCSASDLVRANGAEFPESGMIISSKHTDLPVSKGEAVKTADLHDQVKGIGSEDCHKSVQEDDQGHFDGAENVAELQVDYDSPYEDGELRGSILYSWEGNEIEESECVDYESDGRDGEDSNTVDYTGSEIVEAGFDGSQGTEKKIVSAMQSTETDSRKTNTDKSFLRKESRDCAEKVETGFKKVSNQGSGNMDETPTDMVMGRKHSVNRMDHFDVREPYDGEVGSRASRGKLQSRIEGPSSMDILGRKEPIYAPRSRSNNVGGPFSRSERDGCPDRFITRYKSSVYEHSRDGGDCHSVNWDSRNRFPSTYRGLEDHGQSRPRNPIADSIDKFGGMNFHDHKQPINYSSKGMQRQLCRRRSPVNRGDTYGVQGKIGGLSNNRNRGSFGNFAGGIGRGTRDDYNDPILDESPASAGRIPNYLSRRDWSFSPSSRFTHVAAPRQRSRSRSRTRSPQAWQHQRERNLGARRRSGSPEFRSNSRVERMRVPFQKPSFTAGYEESYMSPPRARFSPQRNCRWVDERSFEHSHLRSQRSPTGAFRRNQRLENGLAGRLKSDDYFRSMNRPRRDPVTAGIGRGSKFENCDDRRHDDRYEMIQRVRQSDSILRRP